MCKFYRILVTIVLLSILFSLISYAEEEANLSFSVDYVSKYVFRGQDVLWDNKPAIQPSLTLEAPSGLLFNIWTSMAISDRDEYKYSDEVDILGEYSSNLTEMVGYSVGAVAFLYPNSDIQGDGSAGAEFYGGLSLDTYLSPSATFYYEFLTGNNGYLEFSVEHTQSVNDVFEITASGAMGYDNGQFIEDSGITNIDFSVTPTASFNKFSIYGQAHYVIVPDKDLGVNDEDEFWFGVGLGLDLGALP